jgi:hypothetical protein
VKKRTAAIVAFISILFVSATTKAWSPDFAEANPYMYHEITSPRPDTSPPKISIASPQNKTYNVNEIDFAYNVSKPEGPGTLGCFILRVCYKADWLKQEECDYDQNGIPQFSEFEEFHHRFTGIPDGNHSILINSTGSGGYVDMKTLTWYGFDIVGYAVVNFTVDTVAPEVSLLHPGNETYQTSNIAIDFTVNEQFSLITYSLDGQQNVTITGNAILTGLSEGEHDITLYATDVAGNVGSSRTVSFSVVPPKPMLTEPVAVASMIAASVFVAGLAFLLVHKKRNGRSRNT